MNFSSLTLSILHLFYQQQPLTIPATNQTEDTAALDYFIQSLEDTSRHTNHDLEHYTTQPYCSFSAKLKNHPELCKLTLIKPSAFSIQQQTPCILFATLTNDSTIAIEYPKELSDEVGQQFRLLLAGCDGNHAQIAFKPSPNLKKVSPALRVSNWRDGDFGTIYEQYDELVCQTLAKIIKNHATILDIHGSQGQLALKIFEKFAKRIATYIFIESYASNVKQAQERLSSYSQIEYLTQDLSEVDFSTLNPPLIIIGSGAITNPVLKNKQNAIATIKNLAGILNQNGFLILPDINPNLLSPAEIKQLMPCKVYNRTIFFNNELLPFYIIQKVAPSQSSTFSKRNKLWNKIKTKNKLTIRNDYPLRYYLHLLENNPEWAQALTKLKIKTLTVYDLSWLALCPSIESIRFIGIKELRTAQFAGLNQLKNLKEISYQ